MNIFKNKKLLKVLAILFLIFVAFFTLSWLMPRLVSERAQEFIEGLGVLGPLVVILYIVLSHIFAPVSGTPMMLLSVAVFGLYKTMVYSYFASAVSAIICFYISRKFGRALVLNLVGEKTMKQIDDFVEYTGTEMLIFSRLYGFTIFDIFSYAAGLTKISFCKYFIVTILFSIPPRIVVYYLFKDINLKSPIGMAIWIGALVTFAVLFSIFAKKFIDRKKARVAE